jgi:hypothetical protein
MWLDGHRPVLKPGTAPTYESLLRSRILPTFARKQTPYRARTGENSG